MFTNSLIRLSIALPSDDDDEPLSCPKAVEMSATPVSTRKHRKMIRHRYKISLTICGVFSTVSEVKEHASSKDPDMEA